MDVSYKSVSEVSLQPQVISFVWASIWDVLFLEKHHVDPAVADLVVMIIGSSKELAINKNILRM